jgi:hypothetical protein
MKPPVKKPPFLRAGLLILESVLHAIGQDALDKKVCRASSTTKKAIMI